MSGNSCGSANVVAMTPGGTAVSGYCVRIRMRAKSSIGQIGGPAFGDPSRIRIGPSVFHQERNGPVTAAIGAHYRGGFT